jgi:hypothetical protein
VLYVNGNFANPIRFTDSFSPGMIVDASIPGDINNDGKDDILIGRAPASGTDNGRVYLLAHGGFAPPIPGFSYSMASTAVAYWEGFSLGVPYVVGDVNRDGIDDIAIGRRIEGAGFGETVSAFVIPGSSAFYISIGPVPGNLGVPGDGFNAASQFQSADLAIARVTRNLSTGYSHGAMQLYAGDFDGDRLIDLAVGLPFATRSATATTPGATFDPLASRAGVFFGIAVTTYGANLLNFEAPTVAMAGSAGERFGVLPIAPGMDLNADRVDDLVVAAPLAVAHSVTTTVDAGRVSVIFGGRSGKSLPTQVELLTNTDIAGSGLYLVGAGNGQPVAGEGRLAATGVIDFLTSGQLSQFDVISGDWDDTGVYLGATTPGLALLKTAEPVGSAYFVDATSSRFASSTPTAARPRSASTLASRLTAGRPSSPAGPRSRSFRPRP